MPAPKRTPENQRLGAALKAIREGVSDLRQVDVAVEVNVSEATYAQWEEGYSGIKLLVVPRLAEVFGLTVGDFTERLFRTGHTLNESQAPYIVRAEAGSGKSALFARAVMSAVQATRFRRIAEQLSDLPARQQQLAMEAIEDFLEGRLNRLKAAGARKS